MKFINDSSNSILTKRLNYRNTLTNYSLCWTFYDWDAQLNIFFFDQLLINVLFNIHQEIYCTLFDNFVNVVNNQTKIIIKELQEKLNDAIVKWSKTFKSTNKSKMSVINWLMFVKRMKILNNISRLETLNDIKSLNFTN
jgi:hypothetical protein